MPDPILQEHVPLAPRCTLGLGGPARYYAEAASEDAVRAALAFARARDLPLALLGGGSNVVVADAGFPGLVLHVAPRGIDVRHAGRTVFVTAAAGEPWDEVVAATVQAGWAGLECLSGIPGLAGGTPVQNVGAYGQEVAQVIHRVRALDLHGAGGAEVVELDPPACQFAYRDSLFKRTPGRYVVLSVTFALEAGGPPTLRYPELVRAVGDQGDLQAVRRAVLTLRRAKSMVIDPADENRRSVGSFFMNPVVPAALAGAVVAEALRRGLVTAPEQVPQYPAPDRPGQVKLAAAWLIERAGAFHKGLRRGAVGISSRHALALVHHGGGTSAELVALAQEVQAAVLSAFAVRLHPEPIFLGFPTPPL